MRTLITLFTSILALSLIAPSAWAADQLLVLSKASSRLAFIDPNTMTVLASVPTGAGPHEVCITADGKLAVVADYGAVAPGNTLSVYDMTSRERIAVIDLDFLRRPHGIAEINGKIYFTSETTGTVGRVDLKTMKVDGVFGTGQAGSHMLAIDPLALRIYTTDLFANTVTAIEPRGLAGQALSTARLAIPNQPEGIALSPDARHLWVGPRQGGFISVIDTLADAEIKRFDFDGIPIRMNFTPDGSRVIVSDALRHRIVVIDSKTYATLGEVPTAEVPAGQVITPDSKKVFVSCAAGNKVLAIDLTEMKVIGEVDAGPIPDGIALWTDAPRTPAPGPGSLGVQMSGPPEGQPTPAGETGALVSGIAPGSAAEKAGILPGDRIIKLDSIDIAHMHQFVRLINRCRAGSELTLAVVRGDQTIQVPVVLLPRGV